MTPMTASPRATQTHLASATIAPREFRRVLGHFLTGVVVVATMDGTEPVGLTVGSFFSVSLDPPLVGFCASRSSSTWPVIKQARRFCVNVLAADQEAVSRKFAGTGTNKFEGIAWTLSHLGCPKLDNVLAWIECEIDMIHDAGDHEICVGRVVTLGDGRRWPPLPFFRGGHQIP
jgi:3-hydroxy-9,10-secoandrosta-1,3,5(10)-triene-9,17-dione monooxygenase reductase component